MSSTPTAPVSPTEVKPPEIRSAAEALQAVVKGDLSPSALTIEYRVGSEAWGGASSVLIQGSGTVEVTHSLVGEHTSWFSTLSEEEFLDLCLLLVEHEVWAIRGEREEGLYDEARPNVAITAEGFEPLYVGMWDGEAAEHPDFGPIVRELDWLAYEIRTASP